MPAATTAEISPQQLRRARRWMLGLRVLMYGTLLTLALVLFVGRGGGDVSHAAGGGHLVSGHGRHGTLIELWVDGHGDPTGYHHGPVPQTCDLLRGPIPDFGRSTAQVVTGGHRLTAGFRDVLESADGVRADQRFHLAVERAGDAWIGTISFTHSWARHGTKLGSCHAYDTFTLRDVAKR
jgi:hypothetical protein